MKTIPITHILAALGFAALGVVAAIFVPEARWEKLADLVSRIVEDPAGATVAVSLIAGAITTLRAAWLRQPPGGPPPPAGGGDADGPPTRPRRPLRVPVDARRATLVLGALVLSGCGASALQTHATIAVAMEAGLGVSRPLLAPACDVAATSCAADAVCLEGVARDCRAAVASWEVTHAAVLAYVEALQAADLAGDEGVLPALGMVLAASSRAWASTVAALALVGVTLPALPDAAGALLGAIGGGS